MLNYDEFHIIISSFLFFSHHLFNYEISINTSVNRKYESKAKAKTVVFSTQINGGRPNR